MKIFSQINTLKPGQKQKFKGRRIAIISNMAWNVANFRMNVVKALVENGAEVIVFAPVDEHVSRFSYMEGVTYVPVSYLHRRGINPFNEIFFLFHLVSLFRKYRPSCVLQYTIKPNIYGSIAGYIARIPTISVVTGLGYTYIHNTWIKPLVKLLYKISFRLTKIVLVENQDDLNELIADRVLRKENSFLINGTGVDLREFSSTPMETFNQKTKFLFIGRLLYDKGIREYVEAAIILKKQGIDAEFQVLGPLDKENPAHISDLELAHWTSEGNIKYLGQTERVIPFITNADFVVLPSYREGLPKSIMEAMAIGRPVIVSDVPGCRSTVEEGVNGWLCKSRDALDLARCLNLAHNTNFIDRHIMGQSGRSKAEREFDDRKIADTILNRIVQVLT